MANFNTHELREKYLGFFESKGHARVGSASLVPENDPTTLFTGSGMQPMLPYLLGEKHPQGKRIVDSQKCFRTQDIAEVGDSSHTTFFEMLGNWSFGDYFKQEQIEWIFEFVTEEIGLDPARIYVSAFGGNDRIGVPKDEETVSIWQKMFKSAGVDFEIGNRIQFFDEDKNWWSRAGLPDNMPVGEPGGPDSEMFWDFGADLALHERSPFKNERCNLNCACGRYLEIGNSVFMEYQKEKKSFKSLAQRNVDFGGGLERMMAAAQDNPDIFRIDLFNEPVRIVENMTGAIYGANELENKAFRVILDHVRAAVFLIDDGVMPSRKDQGYFVRRLIRRAVRFGQYLGMEKNFCAEVAGGFISSYGLGYPSLTHQREVIEVELNREENKFRQTLAAGLREFEKLKDGDISGAEAFRLYQSFGFPLEMVEEVASERGLKVDRNGFEREFAAHQKASKTGAEKKFKGGLADNSEMSVKYHTATHLLHEALREVLGEHVKQKGSNITSERLRFDFSHTDKLTDEEVSRVEQIINQKIEEGLAVKKSEMTVNEARTKGALGLFEDTYQDIVSVYEIGDFSVEICGGPHVLSTKAMGVFKIVSQGSVGAGLRRIKGTLS